ncbi:MAG: Tricarboxylate transport protein TctC [Herminiimonas sp.]|nr:Tricarboxylate transport protein TctC [Herminiimonas sp.]
MKSFKFAAAIMMAGVVTMGSAGVAQAQNYPHQPITIVVPYPPGGTNDIVARMLGKKLGEQMGQPVIVENRAGASGTMGAGTVARAPADGYTLLLITTGHTIHPALYPKLPYEMKTSFQPISKLTSGPMLVMVTPSLPVKNLQDLIALAKSKPGELNYGSAGNGSTTHLTTELIDSLAGIKMTHVPYKGSAPAMMDVMSGNAQVVLDLVFSAQPHVKSGKLKALAITGAKRSSILPNVPTVAESGIPGFEATVWNGLVAPAGTPKDVVTKLNAEIKKAMADPKFGDQLHAQGFDADWSTPEQLGTLVSSEMTRWGKVVKDTGTKLD